MDNEKGNAHPVAGTTEQATEKNAARKIPHSNYTATKCSISRRLSHGQQNAVPLRHLKTEAVAAAVEQVVVK